MIKDKSSIEYISGKYGILSFTALLIYFLFMKYVGLVHMVELRALNFIILVSGVWLALREYKKAHKGNIPYFEGIGIGLRTTFISVIPFAIFIFAYLMINPAFMEMIKQNEMFGEYMNPFALTFLIAFEGTLSGFFIAYTLMQYEKKEIAGHW